MQTADVASEFLSPCPSVAIETFEDPLVVGFSEYAKQTQSKHDRELLIRTRAVFLAAVLHFFLSIGSHQESVLVKLTETSWSFT